MFRITKFKNNQFYFIFYKLWYNKTIVKQKFVKELKYMKKKKLLYVILCALGGGFIGFFANQLAEWYGCVFFGLGVALMVYSIINLSK